MHHFVSSVHSWSIWSHSSVGVWAFSNFHHPSAEKTTWYDRFNEHAAGNDQHHFLASVRVHYFNACERCENGGIFWTTKLKENKMHHPSWVVRIILESIDELFVERWKCTSTRHLVRVMESLQELQVFHTDEWARGGRGLRRPKDCLASGRRASRSLSVAGLTCGRAPRGQSPVTRRLRCGQLRGVREEARHWLPPDLRLKQVWKFAITTRRQATDTVEDNLEGESCLANEYWRTKNSITLNFWAHIAW